MLRVLQAACIYNSDFFLLQETLPELMNTDASDRVAPRFDRKKVNFKRQRELVLITTNNVDVSSFEATG